MESVGLEERAGGGSRSSTVAWSHMLILWLHFFLWSWSQSRHTPRYLCAHEEVAVPWDGVRLFPWMTVAIVDEAAAQLNLSGHRCIFFKT